MAETKGSPVAEDSKEFTRPQISDEVSSHIEDTSHHERRIMDELESVGGKSEGHAALTSHKITETHSATLALNHAKKPEEEPVEDASRWNKIFNKFRSSKKKNG